ncbi:uncharacterized protein JCM15063_005958 [Sporobolomyces koalae]|uniref:uncharacterized protein n=1 Tax=Sporobolomyces koalae TaxID=500713 RepID=UPI00317CD912
MTRRPGGRDTFKLQSDDASKVGEVDESNYKGIAADLDQVLQDRRQKRAGDSMEEEEEDGRQEPTSHSLNTTILDSIGSNESSLPTADSPANPHNSDTLGRSKDEDYSPDWSPEACTVRLVAAGQGGGGSSASRSSQRRPHERVVFDIPMEPAEWIRLETISPQQDREAAQSSTSWNYETLFTRSMMAKYSKEEEDRANARSAGRSAAKRRIEAIHAQLSWMTA